MIQLGAWLAFCFVVAVVLHRRPSYVIAGIISLWIMIPAIAAHVLTGTAPPSSFFQPSWLHPASWFTLVLFIVQLFLVPGPLIRMIYRHPFLILVAGVFTAGTAATSVLMSSGGLRLLANQIVTPLLLAILIIAYVAGDAPAMRLLRATVLTAAAVQSVLALIQTVLGEVLFFESEFMELYWFRGAKQERWMGTTDGPLTLALLLVVAAMMSTGLKRAGIRFSLLVLYTVAMLATQSRTGVLFMLLALFIAVLLVKTPLWARLLSLMAVGLSGIAILYLGLADGLFGRLENDTGSTDARLSAFVFFFNIIPEYLIGGAGLTASYDIGRIGGLNTSLESSAMMYAIDVGLVLAVLYFGAMVVILVRYGFRAPRWIVLAATAGFILVNLSSALAFSNLSGALLWTILAMVIAGSYPVEEPRRAIPEEESESLSVVTVSVPAP